jgi:nucleotide-binding universal stress UspA family protein
LRAKDDFRQARRRADLEALLARLTGKSAELLCYPDVRHRLQATETQGRTLKDIPLDAIVGSVGRCGDFTRSFLPQHDSDEDRWANVEIATLDQAGLPPITVYQIGEVYFVLDGHHRVSVARRLGASAIEANVIEVETDVPLEPDTQPDDLIIKGEHADFLSRTRLGSLRPGVDFSVSVPGQYAKLLEHISVHRWYMGEARGAEVPYEESVAHWYDEVYLPVVRAIRERGLLRDFPGRTETDLYLWVSEHREELKGALDWGISPHKAAADLALRASPRRIWARLKARAWRMLSPGESAAPGGGSLQQRDTPACDAGALFADILVAVDGSEGGWQALHQAFELARREGARLHGLHLVASHGDASSREAQEVRRVFAQRCQEEGVHGDLAVDIGRLQWVIGERARLMDLTVLNLIRPSADSASAWLTSGMAAAIRRSARPTLVVPSGAPASPMDRILVVFDDSPNADEALFAATYLASRWKAPLAVVSVVEDSLADAERLIGAGEYAEACGVQITLIGGCGSAASAILQAAEDQQSNLLVLGGYARGPAVGAMLGSTVDDVLRKTRIPTLICQ